MKVMMVCGSYPPARCGVGDYTFFLCKKLVDKSTRVSVLTSSYMGIKSGGKNPKVIPEMQSWKLGSLKKAVYLAATEKPDIVHIQYPNLEYKKNFLTNFLPVALKIFKPAFKIVQTFHEPFMELSLLGRLRLFINMMFADALVFVERENMLLMPWYMKLSAAGKKIVHIPVASNIPRAKKEDFVLKNFRKKWNISPEKKVFMTFGFITPVKGYELLLERVDFTKFEWVHLGAPAKNDAYQRAFLNKAAEKGVRINFTGHLPANKTALYLASAGMCVFPFREGVTDRHATYLAAAVQGVYCVAFHALKRGYVKKDNTYYAALEDTQALIKGMMLSHNKKNIMPAQPLWTDIAKQHKDLYKALMKNE